MFNIDNTQAQSVTATVCENAQLFGATPERDEFDPREVWDADDTMSAVSEAFRIIAEGVGPDGTQLADERESLLWGFVNTFDAQVRRLDRSVDRLSPELRACSASRTAPKSSPASSSWVSGAGCPPEFQLDAGSKFQGRSSRMRDCGWPAAIFSSVFVSQA